MMVQEDAYHRMQLENSLVEIFKSRIRHNILGLSVKSGRRTAWGAGGFVGSLLGGMGMGATVGWCPPAVIPVAIGSWLFAFGSAAFHEFDLRSIWKGKYPEWQRRSEKMARNFPSLEGFVNEQIDTWMRSFRV